MKTVGSLLKEARESAHLTIEDISKHTRIREDYLTSIEENAFDALPKGPFLRGFLRQFSQEVGLNPETVVAVFRRDFGKEERSSLVPKGLLNPIRRKTYVLISPQLLAISILCLVAALFVGIQWYFFTQPPQVVIQEPVDGISARSPVIVRGKTVTDVVVTVNQVPVSVDQDGRFVTQLELSLGSQMITVEAKNRQGNSRVVQRSLNIVE